MFSPGKAGYRLSRPRASPGPADLIFDRPPERLSPMPSACDRRPCGVMAHQPVEPLWHLPRVAPKPPLQCNVLGVLRARPFLAPKTALRDRAPANRCVNGAMERATARRSVSTSMSAPPADDASSIRLPQQGQIPPRGPTSDGPPEAALREASWGSRDESHKSIPRRNPRASTLAGSGANAPGRPRCRY